MNTTTTTYTLHQRFRGLHMGEYFAHNGNLYRRVSRFRAVVVWPAADGGRVPFRLDQMVYIDTRPTWAQS